MEEVKKISLKDTRQRVMCMIAGFNLISVTLLAWNPITVTEKQKKAANDNILAQFWLSTHLCELAKLFGINAEFNKDMGAILIDGKLKTELED